MNKKLLLEFKQKLEKERAITEEQLKRFAKEDEKLKGDWNTLFPHWGGETGGTDLEKAADEVEEYSTLLPIEYNLELKLKNIDLALEKINLSTRIKVNTEQGRSTKKDKYGICEKCGKKIDEKRLKVYPEARLCIKCQKK